MPLAGDARLPLVGSQLADAVLAPGDRVVSVDGQLVHTNAEIQRALRGHLIGETMPIEVVRPREAREISVARVGDLASGQAERNSRYPSRGQTC
jgi:S1-C subfamily serine protease